MKSTSQQLGSVYLHTYIIPIVVYHIAFVYHTFLYYGVDKLSNSLT